MTAASPAAAPCVEAEPTIPPRTRRRTALGVLAVSTGVAAAVWTSTMIAPSARAHELALFCHLVCLVVGFDAVLAVDWVGLLWAVRRRSLAQVLETAGHLHVPIWCGYAGLVVSGAFLEPDLGSPLTVLKLGLVVVVGWNGVLAARLLERLARVGDAVVTHGTRAAAACSVAVSQAGWWVSTAIGYANAS